MASSDTFFVTTPIYYVNDTPHIGHAYTTVAADVISRYKRLKGCQVRFLTGTDEHGQKVLRAAQARGLSSQEHVDELVKPFQALWERLDITHDDFIRTTEPRHKKVVQQVLARLYEEGKIYRASYEGWYSTAAERFWTEKDLVDGKCPESGQPVELIREDNWFFKMGEHRERLLKWVEENPEFVRPESRRNEVLGYLRQGLGDLCISRPKARMPWGIELPFDTDYVTYVWFDALLNYISAIGYGTDDAMFERWWPASVHLVGKDILTTHAVYWSTMLFAMGLDPARCLFAHGWWTIEGRKMSKTLKNVVDPNLLLDAYGPDALRYFLLREVTFGADGDFSHRSFQLRYNADLANDLGNLAHRSLSMTQKWLGGQVPETGQRTEAEDAIRKLAERTVVEVDRHYQSLSFQQALAAIWDMVQAGNKYIDTEQPWTLNKQGRRDRLGTVMRTVLEVCRAAAVLLSPVCPRKSSELLEKLGCPSSPELTDLATLDHLEPGRTVEAGEPLFPRMAALPGAVLAALEPHEEHTGDETGETDGAAAQDPTPPAAEERHLVTYDDFARLDLEVGLILAARRHPKADRLLVLDVDLGEGAPRTIVAGIASRYTPEELVGRNVVVVANLKPVKLRGIESRGMILAAGGKDDVELLTVGGSPVPGTKVK